MTRPYPSNPTHLLSSTAIRTGLAVLAAGVLTALAVAPELAASGTSDTRDTPPATIAANADSNPVGLLILTPQHEVLAALGGEADLDGTDCRLWQHGQVGSFRGPMALGEARAWGLVACQTAQLDTADGRARLRAALGLDARTVMLEGGFLERQPEFAPMAAHRGRYTVIKIGAFNNLDPDTRDAGWADFMEIAAERPHAFTREAMIGVERAVGMPTPDTVEVFYYDTPADAVGFGTRNRDIVDLSYAFNARHFERYVYFGAGPHGSAWPQGLQLQAGEPAAFVLAPEDLSLDVPHGRLAVTQQIIGTFGPAQLLIMRAADAEGLAREDVRVFTADMPTSRYMQFDPERLYTLAIAWRSEDHPQDYDAYLDRIIEDVADVGGRFLIKLQSVDMTGGTSDDTAPDRITLVEWSGPADLAELRTRTDYLAAYPLFERGISRFEFLALTADQPAR